MRLVFSAACLPHPDKAKKGGEDAYFADPAQDAFGVADGVGGWADSGVDSGAFSRRLLRYCYEDISAGPLGLALDLEKTLYLSQDRLLASGLEGGTTCFLGQLHGNVLSLLNLGDSGAIVLRPAVRRTPGSKRPVIFPRVIYRSSDQTHFFNCPFQVSSTGPLEEEPDLVHVEVRVGDIVVAASDGIFDNLFDHQLQAIVARHLGDAWKKGGSVEPKLQRLAKALSDEAQRVGRQEGQDVFTPFTWAAHTEGLRFEGGKLDDATVVLGLVSSSLAKEGAKPDKEAASLLPSLHNFGYGEE